MQDVEEDRWHGRKVPVQKQFTKLCSILYNLRSSSGLDRRLDTKALSAQKNSSPETINDRPLSCSVLCNSERRFWTGGASTRHQRQPVLMRTMDPPQRRLPLGAEARRCASSYTIQVVWCNQVFRVAVKSRCGTRHPNSLALVRYISISRLLFVFALIQCVTALQSSSSFVFLQVGLPISVQESLSTSVAPF
jgi:hypothetical protein